MRGIEPPTSAWKADMLASTPHPHIKVLFVLFCIYDPLHRRLFTSSGQYFISYQTSSLLSGIALETTPAGFEPANTGIKILGLTAWRRGIKFSL